MMNELPGNENRLRLLKRILGPHRHSSIKQLGIKLPRAPWYMVYQELEKCIRRQGVSGRWIRGDECWMWQGRWQETCPSRLVRVRSLSSRCHHCQGAVVQTCGRSVGCHWSSHLRSSNTSNFDVFDDRRWTHRTSMCVTVTVEDWRRNLVAMIVKEDGTGIDAQPWFR